MYSSTFCSLLHSTLGNMITPFHAVTCLLSSTSIPFSIMQSLERPLPCQCFLTYKGKKKGLSLPQNHHNSHSILMEINGHYWVPVSHNGPAPKVLYQHTTTFSNSFLLLLIISVYFNHPNQNFSCFCVPNT